MSQLHKSLFVPFSTEQMFRVVNNIASYPDFLPWCGGARVLSHTGNELHAEITIAKGPVNLAFSTKNLITPNESIDMKLMSGPFKHLSGRWLFEPRGERSCQITLSMNFEFNNRLMTMTIGPVFEQIVGSLVNAFKQRANQLYSNNTLS